MRRLRPLRPLVLLVLLSACGGGGASPDAGVPDAELPDAAIAPVFFNARDDLSDDELATQALDLLGVAATTTGTCQDCHGLTRQRLFYWRALSDTSLGDCLIDVTNTEPVAVRTMLDCLRDAGDSGTAYHASKLGIFTTGAHLEWFEFMFRRAYGDDYLTEYDEFKARLGMPRGEVTPFDQSQFDIVASWFTRGAPLTDEKLPPDPAPTECTPGVSAAVAAHVTDMATTGWRAVNAQNDLLMFGCGGVNTALDCLGDYPLAGDEAFSEGWNVNVPGQKLRILRENGYRSNFWTRSSADGRFVGNGATTGGAPSRIVDLQRDTTIAGSAFYDPAFFPDNSGFMFQADQAFLCNQSLLVSEPATIIFEDEPQCIATDAVGLYQHVGAAPAGGDYWAVDGQFTSDNGGKQPTYGDPQTGFSNVSKLGLTPIIHTGSAYEPKATIEVATPFEGDAIISTSSQMVLSRLSGPQDEQLGYVMRKVTATPTDTGYDVSLNEVARYCMSGGKPAFSYDDRWLVLHHYVTDEDAQELGFTGPDDPAFGLYHDRGSSNIYLIDTLTGQSTRITNMKPSQYALFPHFRSDGWIYFMVRTLSTSGERIVASDAALRMEALP